MAILESTPRLRIALKWTIFGAVFYFVAAALVDRFREVPWNDLAVSYEHLALAWVFAAVGKALSAATIYGALNRDAANADGGPRHKLDKKTFSGGSSPTIGWMACMCIAWLPQLGKYIPGKFASVVGTVWLMRSYHIAGSRATILVIWLSGLSVLVGLTLSAPLTLWQPIYDRIPLGSLSCLILLAAGTATLHPRIFNRLCTWFLREFKQAPIDSKQHLPEFKWPLCVIILQFTFHGIACWFAAHAFAPTPPTWIPVFISANALAMTAGFLALFAPGGLGVREGILLVTLSPAIGSASAALVVVSLRLIHFLSEIMLAASGLVILSSRLWTEGRSYAAKTCR